MTKPATTPATAHTSAATPETASPALTIIVVAYQAAATIERCLDALVRQDGDAPLEILVVDSGNDQTSRLVSERHPGVKLVRSPARLYPGAARNLGIAHARGTLIGFVDADCVAAPDWAARVLEAHRGEHAVVGGTVANGDPENLAGWAQHLCEFSAWMPGTGSGPMRDLPTCCYSLKRAAFARYGPFRTHGYCSDTAFNWALVNAGKPPRLDASIRVAHIHATAPMRLLRKQWMHGRAFAQMRVEVRGLAKGQRLLLALGTPALPVLLAARIARRLVRMRQVSHARMLAAAPLACIGLCAWSCGELIGYLWPVAEGNSHVSAMMSV